MLERFTGWFGTTDARRPVSHVEPRVVRPEDREGQPTTAGGDVYSQLARGEHTHDSYFLVHAVVPPGGGTPPHVHTREEEAFYVIRGEVTFYLGDDEVRADAGTFLNVPRDTVHRFRNVSGEDAEMIFWFAPAGIEGLFDELGEHPEDIIEIGERYGTRYFLDGWTP